MKTLFFLVALMCTTLFLNAQENVYAYHSVSYTDENPAEIKNTAEPIVYAYENDPVSKITIYPINRIMEVTMQEGISGNLILSDETGLTLVNIAIDENKQKYKFSLKAYDYDVYYLINNGEAGIYMYTIDISEK